MEKLQSHAIIIITGAKKKSQIYYSVYFLIVTELLSFKAIV